MIEYTQENGGFTGAPYSIQRNADLDRYKQILWMFLQNVFFTQFLSFFILRIGLKSKHFNTFLTWKLFDPIFLVGRYFWPMVVGNISMIDYDNSSINITRLEQGMQRLLLEDSAELSPVTQYEEPAWRADI